MSWDSETKNQLLNFLGLEQRRREGLSDSILDDIEGAVDDRVKTDKESKGVLFYRNGEHCHFQAMCIGWPCFIFRLDQYTVAKFAKGFDTMPKFLEKNAGLNATEIISSICAEHASGNTKVCLDQDLSVCCHAVVCACCIDRVQLEIHILCLLLQDILEVAEFTVKVGIPEFLNGIGNGVESHVTKLESEIRDFQKLPVIRTLRLKKLGVPCKHRKLILKYTHKYRLGLWRPRAQPVKA
ncbi:hypothetical protein EV1_019888 [Malus domestica]